jgi:hypothetical protein
MLGGAKISETVLPVLRVVRGLAQLLEGRPRGISPSVVKARLQRRSCTSGT